MSRSTKEWVGASDDTPAPPRVRLRVFLAFDGICQCGCSTKIANKPWQLDHKVALINGGQNRESNFHPLLEEHHKLKTRADVAAKSVTYKKRLKHYGVKTRRGPPMPGSRASGWKRKIGGGWVRRED